MTRPAGKSRRRGVGSITSYATKGGQRWRWQLTVPEEDGAGRRQVGRAGYATAAAADDALQAARQQLRAQVLPTRGGAPLVADYAAQWLDSLRLANSTVYGYQKIVRNHIAPHLGALRVDRLTATRIGALYVELSRSGRRDARGLGAGLSANSVNKVHVVLGAMLDAAIDDGLIAVNPARRTRTVRAPTGRQIRAERPEIVTWSALELRTFLDWDRTVLEDELHVLWHTIAHTGVRRSEALALRWGDIDLTGRRISIRRAADVTQRNTTKTTKANGARVADIDQPTTDLLRSWKALQGSISLDLARGTAYVFGNRDGELRSPNEISRRWTRRVDRARLELGPDRLSRITLKGLRHTHATLLLEIGVHPKVVQERLGHSNISTTMNIYSHVTPTMQRSAVDQLADLLR